MRFSLKSFDRKERVFIFTSLFYIAYIVFPMFAVFTHLPNYLVSAGVATVLICIYPHLIFSSRFLKWFYVYVLILFLYSLAGHKFHINGLGDMPLFRALLIESAWTLPNLLICNIMLCKKDIKLFCLIGIGSLVLLFTSFIVVLPTLVQSAGILRQNLRDEMVDASSFNPFLPSYSLMSAYSYLFPALCFGISLCSGKLRIVFLLLAALLVYVIFKTEITTSMLCIMISTLFAISYKDRLGQHIMVLSLLLIIVFVLYESGALLVFNDNMRNLYEGTVAASKFQDFHNHMVGNEVGNDALSVREYCRAISLDSFFRNPIIGSARVGEHSSILDRLGSMGFLGFIPWAMMMFFLTQSWYRTYNSRCARYFFCLGLSVVFIFLYNKGLFSGEGMLFFSIIMPSSIFALEHLIHKYYGEV